jgi:hypothetical protein
MEAKAKAVLADGMVAWADVRAGAERNLRAQADARAAEFAEEL